MVGNGFHLQMHVSDLYRPRHNQGSKLVGEVNLVNVRVSLMKRRTDALGEHVKGQQDVACLRLSLSIFA